MSIARAFVNRPLILLADEPTGNLDPTTSVGIMRLLDRINRTGTTVVMATHDRGIVDTMRRRVIELDRGTIVRDQARGVYEYEDRRRMALKVDYVVRETATNLRRNLTLTLAVDAHRRRVAVAGGRRRCCSARASTTPPPQWQGGIEFVVFMNPDATPGPDRRGRARARATAPRSTSVTYVDQEAAYEEFKELFARLARAWSTASRADDPAAVVPGGARRHDADAHRRARRALRGASPACTRSCSPRRPIDTILQRRPQRCRSASSSSPCVLLLGRRLLILNTIRMAIFARRREIEVMKLVGATNWFIRVPFMLEGLVQGLVGAGGRRSP